MKKIICLFTLFISVFIFETDYKVQSQIGIDRLRNIADVVCENENSELFSVFINHADDEFFHKLITYADSQEETIMIMRSTQDDDLVNVHDYYIYTQDTDTTFKNIYVKGEDKIDFSRHTNEYYSTDKAMNSSNHIDFLNSTYTSRYHGVINIRQLSSITSNTSLSSNLYIMISSKNKDITMNNIKNSSMFDYFPSDWENSALDAPDLAIVDNQLAVKMLVISSITMLLLTLCNYLKNTKDISIRKMFGMSNCYIVYKLFKNQFLMQLGVYLGTMILCHIIIIGHMRPVTYPFLQSQLKFFLFFVGLRGCLYLIMYFMIKITNHVKALKKDGVVKQIVYLDILLKIIVVLIIINPLIQFVGQGMKQMQTAAYLINNEDKLKNQLYIDGFYDTKTMDMSKSVSLMKTYFDEHGGVYQDFNQNEIYTDHPEEIAEKTKKKPYLIVNKAFMEDYEVFTDDGKRISFSDVDKDIILIPKKYEDEDLSQYQNVGNALRMIVKNGSIYANRDPMTALDYNLFKKDAIVLVKNHIDSSSKYAYPNLLLPIGNRDIESIKQEMLEYGIVDGYMLGSIRTPYHNTMQFITDQVRYMCSLLIIYCIVVMTFLYQTVYMYFITNKERFALRYLLGYHFFERHGEMMMINIAAYSIVLLYGWSFLKIELRSLLIFIVLAVIFEVFSALILIRKFEKNKIVSILKGE